MTADIALVSNAASQTLPGAEGTLTFVKLKDEGDTSLRRVAATASTYPRTLLITQQERNLGKRNASRRTVVQCKEEDWTTIVPLENGQGGKADGVATVTVTINRPLGPGYGTNFTTAKINTLLGSAMSAILQYDANILAGEK